MAGKPRETFLYHKIAILQVKIALVVVPTKSSLLRFAEKGTSPKGSDIRKRNLLFYAEKTFKLIATDK
ncbi:hypothetical protein DLM75_21400 [Leptospira stimsonii]|uniref:Uncharacterized protein n=1 Tax=Leptospira stimsonii TaxID=2202203 RepID=A0A396YW07_9LEPT|nr:hypothetical protein DLM75_21400 [Leptospira stimsonii]